MFGDSTLICGKKGCPRTKQEYTSCSYSISLRIVVMSKPPRRGNAAISASKRPYLKQADVPSASLTDALRVPQAILDHYAGKATPPLQVAKALNVDPKGSQVRVLSGASIAFGLIDGGAQAASISVTDVARRILRPKEEGEEVAARREAVLKPRVFGDFLRRYDGHPFPRQDIALNVIEEFGVPRDKAAEVLERIESSARSVGFIEEIKGKNYVTLQGASAPLISDTELPSAKDEIPEDEPRNAPATSPAAEPKGTTLAAAIVDDQRRRRVFITHGHNRDLVRADT
jgi:hypothetical protein